MHESAARESITAASTAPGTDGQDPKRRPSESPLPDGFPPSLGFWIRTPCGRAKYLALAARPGVLARLRLGWFVLIAALRDLGKPQPEQA